MSPFFVKKFKKENRCAECTQYAPETGRTLCSKHLKIARLAFVVWSALRMRARLCIACPKKADEGNNCRCKQHRQRNKVKCRAWVARQIAINPNFVRDKCRAIGEKWAAEGKCRCSGHPPLVEGCTQCAFCQLRHRVYHKAASKADQAEYRRQLRTKLAAKREGRQDKLAQARRELTELGYAAARATSHSKDGWSIKGRITV